MSEFLRSVTAWVPSSSATKVSLNNLVTVSRSEATCLGSQEKNVRLERVKVLDSVSRFRDGIKFGGQTAAEHSKGDSLALERPTNAVSVLHRIAFWQSGIGRRLWWYVRDPSAQGSRNETNQNNLKEGVVFTVGIVG